MGILRYWRPNVDVMRGLGSIDGTVTYASGPVISHEIYVLRSSRAGRRLTEWYLLDA
jgi:hypothetical protein